MQRPAPDLLASLLPDTSEHVQAELARVSMRSNDGQEQSACQWPMVHLSFLGANGVRRSALQLAPETEHSPWAKALVAREKE
eukprot:12326441-Alexandrium_andersonii.AAC.1